MSPAPDVTLLPPGFGELRLLTRNFVLWGGVDGRPAGARVRIRGICMRNGSATESGPVPCSTWLSSG